MNGPAASRLRVVVTGLLAQYPLGGVAWDYLQYPLGLARLGHDVYYLEDTGQWPYDPATDGISAGCETNVAHLGQVMDRVGLGDRWAYRFPWEGRWYGLADDDRAEVVRTADLILNVSGVLRDPAGLERRGVLCYVDTDPVFTQVKLARGQADLRAAVDVHDVHVTFGERLDRAVADGDVPGTGHRWLPTRQPVVLDRWVTSDGEDEPPQGGRFTTVMNWTSFKPIEHEGRSYGQKDVEFHRFLELPARSPVPLEVAVASGKAARTPVDLLRHHGWTVADPSVVCPDIDSYRGYLRGSRGEWSVAKGGYVTGRSGWFSCRSACYLAAGRPVVTQDTGFGHVLPTGEGLLAFDDLDGAVAALEEVESAPRRHARAAVELARSHFDSDQVLRSLIDRVGTTSADAVEVNG